MFDFFETMESLNGFLHGVLKIRQTGHMFYGEEVAAGHSIESVYEDLKFFLKHHDNQIFIHWKIKLQFILQGFGEKIPYQWKHLHNFINTNHGTYIDNSGNHVRDLTFNIFERKSGLISPSSLLTN